MGFSFVWERTVPRLYVLCLGEGRRGEEGVCSWLCGCNMCCKCLQQTGEISVPGCNAATEKVSVMSGDASVSYFEKSVARH